MSSVRASKRNNAGKVLQLTSGSSPSQLGLECLPLSPSQLREIWAFDNVCGRESMNAPLRTCSCEENTEVTPGGSGISISEIEILKRMIKEMWDKAKYLFEIFYDPKHPDLGYRMRVNQSMPIKVTLREDDAFYFGWCAVAPQTSPCSHLYERSPVKPFGYMGGPASFCNWGVGKLATVSLSRPASRAARYLVRLECRNLSRGQELAWNYGCNKEMPIQANWFKECCSVSKPEIHIQRQKRRQDLTPFMNIENCVLCGKPFSIKNKECRIQRKSHFINSHADFLGSSWNGLGPYMQEEVDSLSVLTEADKLNSLIQTFTKDLKWSIIPACNVISSIEKDSYGDDGALLEEFRKRSALLRASGTLVLRGMSAATMVKDFTVDHLNPIPTSVWRTLKWKGDKQPPVGVYSVPSEHSDEHSAKVQSAILNFCCVMFNEDDGDSISCITIE